MITDKEVWDDPMLQRASVQLRRLNDELAEVQDMLEVSPPSLPLLTTKLDCELY